MQNRVTVTVKEKNYTLLAVEDEVYVKRVAAYVDSKLKETGANGLDSVDCAVLTALNIADERFKEQEAAENLRRQIKDLLEESAKLKMELSEAKREIFKLQQKR
jgi:cell division protein ZapA